MIAALVLVTAAVAAIDAATLGDGQTSLITGRTVDYRSSSSCVVNGVTYASETAVPRHHPCHYCICYGGKVDCFWKKCGAIPQGCEIMSFEETCNPSLYICEIPEKARHAPHYGPIINDHTADVSPTSTPTPTTPSSVKGRRQFATNSTTQSARSSKTTTTTTTPATTPTETTTKTTPVTATYSTLLFRGISPPSRHLQPPEISATSSIKAGRLVDEKSPAQFGLRMKDRMRFSRSIRRRSGLLLPIDEPFPITFDQDFIAGLQLRVREKRSILGSSADNHDHHHHHHDHDEPVDTGCTILGVHYLVGQVVGVATDQCQECRCAAQSLFCSPKCCFKPAPLDIVPHLMTIFEETRNQPSDDAVLQNPLYYLQSEFQ